MEEIMNQLDGVRLKESHRGSFKFRMHMNDNMENAPLEMLDLSTRPYNSLKRAGFHTVGNLVDALSEGVNLYSINNCGKTSVREIKEKLFLFQYNSLPENKREAYLLEVVLMNKK